METAFIITQEGRVIALVEGKTRARGLFFEFAVTDIIATQDDTVYLPPAIPMCYVLFIDTLYCELDKIANRMNRKEVVIPF
jgi:hypothetical protein